MRRLLLFFLLPLAIHAELDCFQTGSRTHFELYDEAERLVEQWDEEADGSSMNWVRYAYDEEGHAVQSSALTSAGEAIHRFAYDAEGRLVLLTDPFGRETRISYAPRQVTLADPLGNSWVEQRDSENRLIARERKDPLGETRFKEECFYDDAGNLIRKKAGGMEIAWEYDSDGLLTKQEAHRKTTLYCYNEEGRLASRELPSGIRIDYSYDGEGRLLSQKSSDGSIQDILIQREYDSEGRILSESNGLFTCHWRYDDEGRRTSFTLPDGSKIGYVYEGSHLAVIRRIGQEGALLYEHRILARDLNGHAVEEDLIGRGVLQTSRDLLERTTSQTIRLGDRTLCQRISYGPSRLVESVESTLFGKTRVAYDEMDRLVQYGDRKWAFDERGNPAEWEVDECNQILSIAYDPDGNPIRKQDIQFRYDALGRLTEILEPGNRRVRYAYDSLSRLYSKEIENGEKIFYLYDLEQEIGTLDETGRIVELKVLGEESAIALELNGNIYAPLHDFNGSIVALIDAEGAIVEIDKIDPFGRESRTDSINPWRFCGKRFEEGLYFFGRRFYDPSLKRWLTPDPAGFVDGPNLYAYVRNSPLNRVDPFGLLSININLPIAHLPLPSDPITIVHCKGSIGETKVDWAISCGFWDKLRLTMEEIESGTANLADHLQDLTPTEGQAIGVLSFQNGIRTTLAQFILSCQSIAKKVPEGTLLIGYHNKTKGLTKDMLRLLKELVYTDTSVVVSTREFLGSIAEQIHEQNPNLLWGHILHSESGAIARRAIEGMSYDRKDFLKQHLSLFAMGPVLPIPENYAHSVMNIYSHQDFIGIAGSLLGLGGSQMIKTFFERGNCNIQFIPSSSKWQERSFLFVDHSFLGDTYGTALDKQMKKWRERYSLYDGKN